MKLTSDDVAFVLGRNGTTKRKIARVADCQLELVRPCTAQSPHSNCNNKRIPRANWK